MRKTFPLLWLALLSCMNKASQAKDADAPVPPAMFIAESVPASLHTAVPSVGCPADMVEIDGDYCPDEEQVCLYNTDPAGNKLPGPGDIEIGRAHV